DQEIETIRTTLSNLEGNISAFQLNHLLNLPHFSLNHERLIIKNLNKLTRQQLALKDNIHVAATQEGASFLEFNSSDYISIFCNSCLFGSQQNLSINFRSPLGKVSKQD